MRQQSDAVQHTAQAYAEREVLAACARTLAGQPQPGAPPGAGTRPPSPALRALLEPVVQLYALHRLEQVRRCGQTSVSGPGWPWAKSCRCCSCPPAGCAVRRLHAATTQAGNSKITDMHPPCLARRTWPGSSLRGWCRWRRGAGCRPRCGRCARSWRRATACWWTPLASPTTWCACAMLRCAGVYAALRWAPCATVRHARRQSAYAHSACLPAPPGAPQVASPIAGDWARYNETDNQGELLGERW